MGQYEFFTTHNEDIRIKKMIFFVCIFLVISLIGAAGAADLQPVQLPLPQIEGGNPLVLQKRASSRDFSPEPLPNLLLGCVWN
jgi:hypothetical protein